MGMTQYKRVTYKEIHDNQPKPKVYVVDPTGKNSGGITDIRFFDHPLYHKVIQMKHGDKWCNWFFRWSKEYRENWGWYEPLGVYICNTSIG